MERTPGLVPILAPWSDRIAWAFSLVCIGVGTTYDNPRWLSSSGPCWLSNSRSISAPVTALAETGDGIRVDADGAAAITVSAVALAAGRTPNTDGLRLEDGGVSLDERGFVETDEGFETTADGVYAIGDVSGPPMFTHSARDDADLLYRRPAKDEEVSTEGRTVPWAVFTDPQVGHVGLTEQEARTRATMWPMAVWSSPTRGAEGGR
jgi:pyruvate/2-oxoglutarate dehydrogenase complex dihydrolipoamide dehydrogenase (E3) component